jgi:flagellar basal-body rod modification protein FlgD
VSIDPVTFGLARTAADATPAPTSAPTTGATTQSDPQAIGKDVFLKLLVAQLQYQNPMEPVDSSQFMAQTAQFTMVEKLEEIAKQTDTLLAHETSQTAASLLGRNISYVTGDGSRASGVVNAARFGPNGPVVVVGQTEVPLANVAEVTTAT